MRAAKNRFRYRAVSRVVGGRQEDVVLCVLACPEQRLGENPFEFERWELATRRANLKAAGRDHRVEDAALESWPAIVDLGATSAP